MRVEVRLTEAEQNAIPNFADKLQRFQLRYDKLERDIQEKSRLCLHEGAHAMRYRALGVDVKFFGPHIQNGENETVLGSVLPVSPVVACDWQQAAVSMAGFVVVERLTGLPEVEHVIKNDLATLKSKLANSPRLVSEPEDLEKRFERATVFGGYAIEFDMEKPEFLPALEQAVRDYEREVFHTDECWPWLWNEYRLDLPGTRHRVIVNGGEYDWHAGLLVEHKGELRLVVHGKVLLPEDGVGVSFANMHQKRKANTRRVVGEWNRQVWHEQVHVKV
jgi:hypothetical protein